MLEFDDETLDKISKKLDTTKINANYFYRMGMENKKEMLENEDFYKEIEEKYIDIDGIFYKDLEKGDSLKEVKVRTIFTEHKGQLFPSSQRYGIISKKVQAIKNKALESDIYIKRANRMNQCLNLWVWDKYEKNKVLDLQKVNRCKDRFCPNCRSIALSKSIVEFAPAFKEMLKKEYNPYLITLTVPNVSGADLKKTIDKMYKAFTKFWRWFNPSKKGSPYKNRIFDIMGAIKVLEVNVQKDNHSMYHPHFHIMAFLDNEKEWDFDRYIDGGYSKRKKEQIEYADADIEIMKLWKMAYDGIRIDKYDSMSDDWWDLYLCDIRPMDDQGIYEVFKYTFKDTDLHTYYNFKDIFLATNKKRLRQGHGELFNLKLEDTGENEKVESIEDFLEIKESPERVATTTIQSLVTEYQKYRKISRFKGSHLLPNIE